MDNSNISGLGWQLMRKRTVGRTLFISYFIPLLITITVLSVIFFTYTSRVLKRGEESSLADITDKMISIVDSEIDRMNTISLSITNSGLLKERIEDYRGLAQSGADSGNLEYYLAARDISNLLTMIAGPIKAVPQINFIDPGHLLIGSGTYNLFHKIPESTAAVLSSIDPNFGKALFRRPPNATPLPRKPFRCIRISVIYPCTAQSFDGLPAKSDRHNRSKTVL